MGDPFAVPLTWQAAHPVTRRQAQAEIGIGECRPAMAYTTVLRHPRTGQTWLTTATKPETLLAGIQKLAQRADRLVRRGASAEAAEVYTELAYSVIEVDTALPPLCPRPAIEIVLWLVLHHDEIDTLLLLLLLLAPTTGTAWLQQRLSTAAHALLDFVLRERVLVSLNDVPSERVQRYWGLVVRSLTALTGPLEWQQLGLDDNDAVHLYQALAPKHRSGWLLRVPDAAQLTRVEVTTAEWWAAVRKTPLPVRVCSLVLVLATLDVLPWMAVLNALCRQHNQALAKRARVSLPTAAELRLALATFLTTGQAGILPSLPGVFLKTVAPRAVGIGATDPF